MRKTISICIPVFNEAANVPLAVRTVEEVFAEQLPEYGLEIIITDNASTDESWEIVRRLASDRPHLKAYRFSRNFGYENSVFAGLSLATGDAAVEVDGDLEDPPAVIPGFVAKWEEGCDVVYGVRLGRHGSLFRRGLIAVFYKLLGVVSDLDIPPNSGDFRLLDRRVLDVLKALPERNLFLRGLVSYVGFRQSAVPYRRQPRASGRSKFHISEYVRLAFDAFTTFSTKPIELVAATGFVLLAAVVLLAIVSAWKHLVFGTPVGGLTA